MRGLVSPIAIVPTVKNAEDNYSIADSGANCASLGSSPRFKRRLSKARCTAARIGQQVSVRVRTKLRTRPYRRKERKALSNMNLRQRIRSSISTAGSAEVECNPVELYGKQPEMIERLTHPRSVSAANVEARRDIVASAERIAGETSLRHAAAALAEAFAELNSALEARDVAIAERDAALEEAAFLRERLRSMEAYLVSVLEAQLDEERGARMALLSEVALLNEELQARAPTRPLATR
jgi:hypothetical protein